MFFFFAGLFAAWAERDALQGDYWWAAGGVLMSAVALLFAIGERRVSQMRSET